MKLGKIFKTAIQIGIENDPRGKKELSLELKELKEQFENLPKEKKKLFDTELFENPFADSRLVLGSPSLEVKEILMGIDVEVQEVLLAKELNRVGRKINLLWAHHPEDKALAMLDQVMHIQKFVHQKMGVPISIAEHVMEARIQEVARRVAPINNTRATDAAKLLGFAFINTHTIADNCVWNYLQKKFDKEKPRKIKDVIEMLLREPEYKEAVKHGTGPKIFFGSEENFAGRIMVDMTGGTEGAKEIFECLARAGVGTVLGMHFSEEHKKAAEEAKINLVVAGHMASDTLGMNLLLDELERRLKTKFKIIECSGFKRFRKR